MIGKLVNGVLIRPTEHERRGIIITNPSDESLKYNMGYKDLEIDEVPEYDALTQNAVPYYEETETLIKGHWEIVNSEEESVIER